MPNVWNIGRILLGVRARKGVYTLWAIKRSQLNFVCNFVTNQRILMQITSGSVQ